MSQYDIFWVWWGIENGNDFFLSQKTVKNGHFSPLLRTLGEKISTLDACNLYKTYIFLKLVSMRNQKIQHLSVLVLSCDLNNFFTKNETLLTQDLRTCHILMSK